VNRAAPTGALVASCYPIAQVPAISNHRSYGRGLIGCDNGFSGSYYWQVSLRNRAGGSLSTADGYYVGTAQVATPSVQCTGAYVHSFLYINVGGAGKSDTSGEAGLC
jgi:hypothetical protein